MKKSVGILMPIFSLPSKYGIGDFGNEAREFIDKISEAGLTIWQILPLNPVGYGNSPYQSVCGSAIDPIYISLDELKKDGYIKSKILPYDKVVKNIDYDDVRKYKEKYLKEAYKNQKDTDKEDFKEFVSSSNWLLDYARYRVLQLKNNYLSWWFWIKDEKYAHYQEFDFTLYQEEINYLIWLQYIAYKQYLKLKEYAKNKGVSLMGDIPFYVGEDSSDMWANQDEFLLDENDKPTDVSGVPPDYFSEDGQRWGNPIYDWEEMREDSFTFLINRIKNAAKLYDFLRIDHFRAFDTYYKIPASSPTAKVGTWEKAYGEEFLKTLEDENLNIKLFAEDLGYLFPSVLELRDKFNLPGMNVLEFTLFDKSFKKKKNQIVYTGTHDNDTVKGWYESLSAKDKKKFKLRMKQNKIAEKSVSDQLIEYSLKVNANYCIIPMWDINGYGKEARINVPGTVGFPNWTFRINDFNDLDKGLKKVSRLIKKYVK